MSKLDWEKQNRLELLTEKRRVSNRTKVLKAYENGAKNERERIMKLLDSPLHHNIQSPDIHKDCYTCVLVDLIKGEQK